MNVDNFETNMEIRNYEKRLFYLIIFLLPLAIFGQSKKPGYEGLYKYPVSEYNPYGWIITTPLNYSASDEDLPLFVFLHGRTLRGNNLDKLTNVYGPVCEQKRGFLVPGIVLAPQCADGSWSYGMVDTLIEWTKSNYRVDRSRIYILGMSMGGSGTWICGSRLNHKIAAIAPMCGGSYMEYDWTNPCALKKMPIWTFHGKLDKDVSVNETYKTVDAIKNCGGGDVLKTTYFPQKGHDLAFLFKDPQLYEWLLSHKKTDFQNYWEESQEYIPSE